MKKNLGFFRSLAELGIIVAGVLIALTADAYWQDRQERERELGYLTAIRADMVEATEQLRDAFSRDSIFASDIGTILPFLTTNEPLSSDDNDITNFPQFLVAPFSVPTGTLEALISSGDLSLIRSEEVRAVLIRNASALDRNLGWIDDVTAQAISNVQDLTLGISEIRVELFRNGGDFDIEKAGMSPVVVSTALNHLTILQNRLGAIQASQTLAEEILTVIDDEIGGPAEEPSSEVPPADSLADPGTPEE